MEDHDVDERVVVLDTRYCLEVAVAPSSVVAVVVVPHHPDLLAS